MSSIQDQISKLETKLILKHYQQIKPLESVYLTKIRAEAGNEGLSEESYVKRLQRILKGGR